LRSAYFLKQPRNFLPSSSVRSNGQYTATSDGASDWRVDDRHLCGAVCKSATFRFFPIARAPRFQWGVNYQHNFMLANADNINFNINSDFVGPQDADYTNNPGSIQSSYKRTGVSITYERSDNLTVTAYIRDIENTAVPNTWPAAAPGETAQDVVTVDPPRTFGVSVKMSF
jgi:outer membrane receptor protein involved in Fe transport